MTKRRKTIAVALSILALVLVFLVAANRYISDSFTLVAYEEGQPITDPSLNVPEDARLTEAYSSKGHIREHDSRGDLIQSDFVFWLPVTVNAIKAPKQVTYRVLDDDMGISLPNGSKGSNHVVPGKDATGYMQTWFYVATHENWAALKDSYGIDINADFVGGAVYPMEVLDSPNVNVIYRKG